MTLVGLAALPFLVAAYMVAAAQAFGHFDSVRGTGCWGLFVAGRQGPCEGC